MVDLMWVLSFTLPCQHQAGAVRLIPQRHSRPVQRNALYGGKLIDWSSNPISRPLNFLVSYYYVSVSVSLSLTPHFSAHHWNNPRDKNRLVKPQQNNVETFSERYAHD